MCDYQRSQLEAVTCPLRVEQAKISQYAYVTEYYTYTARRMNDLQLKPTLWMNLTVLKWEIQTLKWTYEKILFDVVRISIVPLGGLGRGCGNYRKGHSWSSVLLFLNLGVDDTSMFNLSKCIELNICALFCMYAIVQFLKL